MKPSLVLTLVVMGQAMMDMADLNPLMILVKVSIATMIQIILVVPLTLSLWWSRSLEWK